VSRSKTKVKLVPIVGATKKAAESSAKLPKPAAEKEGFDRSVTKAGPSTDELEAISSSESLVARGDAETEAVQQAWIKSILELGVEGLMEEYKNVVDQGSAAPQPPCLSDKFMHKNRYGNMKCLDETRVVVKKLEGDYIHANYVNQKELILTQGPVKASISDFWQMIWQEKAVVIVMLCLLVEEGKRKCEKYWEEEEGGVFEIPPFTVTTTSRKLATGCQDEQELAVAELSLVKDGKQEKARKIVHFHYLSWPDRSVPMTETFIPSLQLKVQAVRERYIILNGFQGCIAPVIIHCSAGIGRSGTFALVNVLGKALSTSKSPVQTPKYLLQLRRERGSAVQNPLQYVYGILVLVADLSRCLANPADYTIFAQDFGAFHAKLKKEPPPPPNV
jgi:protein tyrosine phosphatase